VLSFAYLRDEDEGRISLGHAYLFEQRGVASPGSVELEGGLVRANKAAPRTVGIGIQYDVDDPDEPGGSLGRLLMQTCLLPERDEPYLLSFELARRRIMMMLEELEERGLFGLPSDDPVMSRFTQAREAFLQALVLQRKEPDDRLSGFSIEADRQAKRAIALSVAAGEELITRESDRLITHRATGEEYAHAFKVARSGPEGDAIAEGAPVRAPAASYTVVRGMPRVGCAVDTRSISDPVTSAAAKACDFVVVPMRWIDMEPSEGAYSFASTDKWIEWAVRTGRKNVTAGPLVDFRRSAVPEWLHIWENDYETLRELVYEHVRQLVIRYRRTVGTWTLTSGLHASRDFSLAPEQAIDLTRVCAMVLRKLHPKATLVVEVSQPWGDYADPKGDLPPTLYCQLLSEAAVSFDAIGLRLQMGSPAPGGGVRDLLSISHLLDRYAEFERPLAISACGAPSTNIGEQPGWWKSGWTPETQARWLTEVGRLAASKPYVRSFAWHQLSDGQGDRKPIEMESGGLVDASGAAKEGLSKLALLRRELHEATAKQAESA
jgi:hypothetical protein